MKRVFTLIVAIALIISIGINIYLFNTCKILETTFTNVATELDNLINVVDKKDKSITEADVTIAELEKTVEKLQKEIESLKEQLVLLDAEKEDLTKQLEEAKETQKALEQSSTAGGAGQTKQPENNPVYAPSSEPNQMDPNEAFGKFGAEFIGSGGGQPKTGSGGYGITLQ